MDFIRAKNFTPAKDRHIDLVVIHTMEAPENAHTAENIARWFASDSAPQASAHYCVDADSIVQTLEEEHIAWGAAGANDRGVHVEHAGYARQSVEDWADDYSTAMLERSAALVADICARHGIPPVRLDAAALLAGERGITGHDAVNAAFKKGTHWDPGPNFPWDWYLERVSAHMRAAAPIALPALPDGSTVPPESQWVRIGAFLVAPRPIAPVSLEQAVEIARAHGCELPTPALVDAIWRAADLRVAPITRTTAHGTQLEMCDPDLIADQARRIEAQIGGRPFVLLAGSHKDVIVGPDGRVGLYGWHRLDGSPIQPPYFEHAMSWKDYSQGVRLVRRAPAERPTNPEPEAFVEEEEDGGEARRDATSEAVEESSQAR